MSQIGWSIEDLKKQYNDLSSGHWFDQDTMRFFKSKLTSQYKRLDDVNALFITTEQGPNGNRRASIRHAQLVEYIRTSDGRACFEIVIKTVGDFNSMSLSQAKTRISKLTLIDLKGA